MVDHHHVDHMRQQPGLDDQQHPAAGADAGGGVQRQPDGFGAASQPAIERLARRAGHRGGMCGHGYVIPYRMSGTPGGRYERV